MKKLLLTIIVGLALGGTAFADCADTYSTGGSWGPWTTLSPTERVASYTCGTCYSDFPSPTYCTSFPQSPDLKTEKLVNGNWVVEQPTGGSCTDHGTAVCPIGGA